MDHLVQHRAIKMLTQNLRPCIVVLETGITKPKARALYRELHGVAPRSGQMRDADSIVRTRREFMAASCIMSFYCELAPNYESGVDPEAVMAAHRIYLEDNPPASHCITLNETWVLARALRSAEARLVTCPKCTARYLEVARQHYAPACSHC
ncbi:FlhC family transcriptional regulator [Salinisphaera sp. T31B1]|uniref:FlhC family transcriptional regulator n=1 Tax=Salinisphaera sp. T31B1 TaxID=727963 RepID=UPI00333F5FEB